MAVKFLSEEWAQAVTEALNSHPGFKSAMGSAELAIQFNTTESPEGDVAYYMTTSQGQANLAMGAVPDPDVTINQNYETASAISKGDLNTQTAFMTGKIKVSGNLAKLMMHQRAITEWGAAVRDIDVEY
ncbi:MAG TPA: SCP2 sterol-binding domain-containing protein [Acidimicrobiia bacterium]|nr:SCP2 sterol-binding domain-containing protein [Acidimicrobiia bacterium]